MVYLPLCNGARALAKEWNVVSTGGVRGQLNAPPGNLELSAIAYSW
jgi:hypothetical protein